MRITDPEMRKKVERALKEADYAYDLDDIEKALASGEMQSHVEGGAWGITQVHDHPKGRDVNIVMVVGDLADAFLLATKIEAWAIKLGARRITGIGREGWWKHRTPGWEKVGVLYSKELNHV